MIRERYIVIGILAFFLWTPLRAQEKETVNWLTFEQLEDSLEQNPKKVFLEFVTDWCTYCRKMDRVVFTKTEVIKKLNDEYYAVRFDAESESEIEFGGKTFVNDQVRKSRNPVHQIAQLLASRDNQFVPPTMVILDDEFNVKARYFEYLDSKKLLQALE
ncbi:thioredoxin family protein [Algoriphagus sediminis]|uniref:Thioredoxin family protein n=1 Tax=Algoriphagus sediminis TaxID=3057113 RepID=A0ABT7Y902_9BACT|nr:thioredoxin fold domain-containing protein [Algoriphagus sediminis]MDN3203000.1 thioredoxin family protein [Algoriphagus sediminis]